MGLGSFLRKTGLNLGGTGSAGTYDSAAPVPIMEDPDKDLLDLEAIGKRLAAGEQISPSERQWFENKMYALNRRLTDYDEGVLTNPLTQQEKQIRANYMQYLPKGTSGWSNESLFGKLTSGTSKNKETFENIQNIGSLATLAWMGGTALAGAGTGTAAAETAAAETAGAAGLPAFVSPTAPSTVMAGASLPSAATIAPTTAAVSPIIPAAAGGMAGGTVLGGATQAAGGGLGSAIAQGAATGAGSTMANQIAQGATNSILPALGLGAVGGLADYMGQKEASEAELQAYREGLAQQQAMHESYTQSLTPESRFTPEQLQAQTQWRDMINAQLSQGAGYTGPESLLGQQMAAAKQAELGKMQGEMLGNIGQQRASDVQSMSNTMRGLYGNATPGLQASMGQQINQAYAGPTLQARMMPQYEMGQWKADQANQGLQNLQYYSQAPLGNLPQGYTEPLYPPTNYSQANMWGTLGNMFTTGLMGYMMNNTNPYAM